jgi:hypothetical protein
MTASAAEESLATDSSAFQQMLDSLGLQKNDLESKVISTLMFGGSSPVSFSGEGRLKMQYHSFRRHKYLTQDDISTVKLGRKRIVCQNRHGCQRWSKC